MTDKLSREHRSRCMAAIKGKDTKPEMIVRRFLFSKGLRYRVLLAWAQGLQTFPYAKKQY